MPTPAVKNLTIEMIGLPSQGWAKFDNVPDEEMMNAGLISSIYSYLQDEMKDILIEKKIIDKHEEVYIKKTKIMSSAHREEFELERIKTGSIYGEFVKTNKGRGVFVEPNKEVLKYTFIGKDNGIQNNETYDNIKTLNNGDLENIDGALDAIKHMMESYGVKTDKWQVDLEFRAFGRKINANVTKAHITTEDGEKTSEKTGYVYSVASNGNY